MTPRLGRGHWNASGHRTAAELIAARLCGEGFNDESRASDA
jgi:hypothetical protein